MSDDNLAMAMPYFLDCLLRSGDSDEVLTFRRSVALSKYAP